MIYTHLTNEAMKIAYNAHHGQMDKGGVPYIFHPYHLAEQMTDEYTTCVALLHDVVEDTNIAMSELEKVFPKEVIIAIDLLTHKDGIDYMEYISKIKQNDIARTVKLADLTHNIDKSRLENNSKANEDALLRWEQKYSKAIQLLNE